MSTSSILILAEGSWGIAYLFFPILIWLFVCASGVAPLVLLRYSNFSPIDDAVPIFKRSLSVLDPVWIEERGFQGKCAIRPLGIPMAIFTNQDQTIAMLVYFAGGQRVVDMVSDFPGGISITTSTTIDGPVVPCPPGVMFQAFRGCDPQDLLEIHQRGIKFLKGHIQAEPVPYKDVPSSMQQFVVRQLNHLIRRPWNILTLPYRWAVTRFVRASLTLEQQERKGIINLESLKRQSQAVN